MAMCKADMQYFTNDGLLSFEESYQILLREFDPAIFGFQLTEERLRQELNLIQLEIHKRGLKQSKLKGIGL